MTKRMGILGLAVMSGGVWACGDSAGASMAQLLGDAGDVLHDAAVALADAGADAQAQAEDAGEGKPANDAAKGQDLACDTTYRYETPAGSGSFVTVYYAVVATPMDAVRAVWVCEPAKAHKCDPGDEVCDAVADAECDAAAYSYARGKLYVKCGQASEGGQDLHYAKARVVLAQ